MTMLLL